MMREIPEVMELLYHYRVSEPDAQRWPDHLKKDPVPGHGLYAFYQGFRLAMQLAEACHAG